MHVLRSSPNSPYVRKVRIAAALLGLNLELAPADTRNPADSLRQQNPLGKLPTLLLEDGEVLFDSRVIVEYLDQLDGRGILLRAGKERLQVLRLQALADGLLDAGAQQIYEARWHAPEHQNQEWLQHQQAKIERALAWLEAHCPPTPVSVPHVGEIALACALGFLDARHEGRWRSTHPRLVQWLSAFARAVPAYEQTRPQA